MEFAKKPVETKAKLFNEIQPGDYFVWADNSNRLMLKVTDDCYFAIDSKTTFALCDYVSCTALVDLSIEQEEGEEGETHAYYSKVFEVEFEIEEPVKWSVIR